MAVKSISSKAQFDELIASGKVVVIDFYADWCGPCKAISPHFKQLAGDHAKEDVVEFYEINIDDLQDVAQECGIQSIPCFHAYKDGERIDRAIGANRSGLTAFVQKVANL